MTPNAFPPGTTLLIQSGTYHDPEVKHLFIVCSNPSEAGEVVLATVSSWKNDLCDSTCILETGCHPFVRRKSHILYRKSRIETVDALAKGVASKEIVSLDPADKTLLERITHGVIASEHTPRKVKALMKKLMRGATQTPRSASPGR